jgi:hypothetical protein
MVASASVGVSQSSRMPFDFTTADFGDFTAGIDFEELDRLCGGGTGDASGGIDRPQVVDSNDWDWLLPPGGVPQADHFVQGLGLVSPMRAPLTFRRWILATLLRQTCSNWVNRRV